jgi:RNA polymerase sigma-70 factor (ECF subfamily)
MDTNPLNTDQLSGWWQRSLEGDSHAFYHIHRELFKGLYNYSLKLLQDTDLANDAVQELFVRLWTKRATIGPLQKVKPYFFTALRRQILNQLRNLQLRELKISRIPRPDIDFSPEEIVVKNEEYRSLQRKISELLNELPKRQKEVIYLHYFEEMDYAQIAAIMGINYQSVLNLTQKALRKLRSADLLSLLLSLSCLYRLYISGPSLLPCLAEHGLLGN